MTRVKMFGAIPRLASVSPQQFHDHYRHPHGTLGRRISLMRSYFQSHHVHSDLLDDTQTRFEACAEVGIDSVEDAARFGQDPVYLADVKDDEPNFVDLDRLEWIFVEENILKSGPDMAAETDKGRKFWRLDNRPTSFKLLQFVIADGDRPWARADDAELGEALGVLRHVRSWPNAALHPDGAFAIGVRELWWGSQTEMERRVAARPDAWAALVQRPASHISFCAVSERFF